MKYSGDVLENQITTSKKYALIFMKIIPLGPLIIL